MRLGTVNRVPDADRFVFKAARHPRMVVDVHECRQTVDRTTVALQHMVCVNVIDRVSDVHRGFIRAAPYPRSAANIEGL